MLVKSCDRAERIMAAMKARGLCVCMGIESHEAKKLVRGQLFEPQGSQGRGRGVHTPSLPGQTQIRGLPCQSVRGRNTQGTSVSPMSICENDRTFQRHGVRACTSPAEHIFFPP